MLLLIWIWDNIEKLSNIANVIIALLTLFLGLYVFFYQNKKDKKDKNIQLLKDLIITPKMEIIEKYFDEISSLRERIKSDSIDDKERIELISFTKEQSSYIRKNFLIFIQKIAPLLHKNISDKIDFLTDNLTETLSNDEHKLCNEKTYERLINQKILETHSFILEEIFKYEG